MTTLNVQFADATEQAIVSYFNSQQDPDAWPNYGTVESSDPRWSAYFKAQNAFMQQFLPAPDGYIRADRRRLFFTGQ